MTWTVDVHVDRALRALALQEEQLGDDCRGEVIVDLGALETYWVSDSPDSSHTRCDP